MRQLERKLKGTRDVLNREIANAVASVREEYQAAQQRENTLQSDLNQQKTFAFGLNDSAVRYLILEREADSNRELYNALLKRVKDLTVVADVHASNVSLVDGAEPPGGPSSPNKSRDAMTAGVLGLAGGLGLAFLMDLLDNTLKDSREVERYLRIPNLAMIPEAPKERESLYPAPAPVRPERQRSQVLLETSAVGGQLQRQIFHSRRGVPESAHGSDAVPRRLAPEDHADHKCGAGGGQDHGLGQHRDRARPRRRPSTVDRRRPAHPSVPQTAGCE